MQAVMLRPIGIIPMVKEARAWQMTGQITLEERTLEHKKAVCRTKLQNHIYI